MWLDVGVEATGSTQAEEDQAEFVGLSFSSSEVVRRAMNVYVAIEK